ncbi:Chromatin structure-remodeling complex protein rsc9 [Exophiala xenobiotica]
MAPPPQRIIEDEEEFLNDVAAFHEKRGTSFDRDGKVSGRPIPLHKLYKLVLARGGYDSLSAERMQWRTLVREFGFGKVHEGVMTFQLKTVYYKNLAAYEIATYWGEEPPPKEILEDRSAKGGNLRTRTLENYAPASSQANEPANAAIDGNFDSADEEQVTPKHEKTESEEPGSATRYPMRQLRQDPKRTQMYQPETQLARTRNIRATDSPSAPPAQQQFYQNSASDPYNPTFDWFNNYKPSLSRPLTLQQVKTPGNDPEFYTNKAKQKLQKELEKDPRKLREAARKSELLPGVDGKDSRKVVHAGLNGPNIYQRCLYGLRSGIPEEQEFALHHLVKVSCERGDKYKFEGFPYLAESLLEKALQITELVYGVKWDITYDEDEEGLPLNTLYAATGTKNLLERIQLTSVNVEDETLEDAETSRKLDRLKETILVIRNMVTLNDNAVFLSKFPLFKDCLTIAITLPDQPRLAEFKLSALEILEHVTRYWALVPKDPLYLSLIPYIESNDRATLISSIRAINNIGIDTPAIHRLTDIPIQSIVRLFSFTLLDDDLLVETTLDFLYEYTAMPENNTESMTNIPWLLPQMVGRLTGLLLHESITREESVIAKLQPAKTTPLPCPVPTIANELYVELLRFHEPERSSRWLRCCFEESPNDDITQIAIWQAYQQRFVQHNPIPAADFIKNVSTTFSTAQAQVINSPVQARFIIKGIKPRRVLIDVHGRPYYKCLWHINHAEPGDQAARQGQKYLCNTWYSTRDKLLAHLISDHMGVQRTLDGQFAENDLPTHRCRWNQCKHQSPFTTARGIAQHLSVHVPATPEAMSKLLHEVAFDAKEPEPTTIKHHIHFTAVDTEVHPPAPYGVAWMSVMILRNLARFANKHGQPFEKNGVKLIEQLFGTHRYRLFKNLGLNKVLGPHIIDLMQLLDKGVKEEKSGVKREHEDDEEVTA